MNKNHDLVSFTGMLVGVGVIYGKEITELLVDLYWQSLKCFEWQDVKRAFEAHIHNADSGQYFPKPADLVRLIEGTGETKALQAWTKVYKAILQIGAYQSIVFDDPLIHTVLDDLGGWVKLCASSIKDLPFRANEFQKRYMVFLNNAPESYPKYCCGITDTVNAINGYTVGSVLLVGDLIKAKQVMQNGSSLTFLTNPENIKII